MYAMLQLTLAINLVDATSTCLDLDQVLAKPDRPTGCLAECHSGAQISPMYVCRCFWDLHIHNRFADATRKPIGGFDSNVQEANSGPERRVAPLCRGRLT